MRRRWLVVVTAVAVPAMWVALLPAGGVAAARVAGAGRSGPGLTVSAWSRAEVIPGQAIDAGGEDQIASLSCGSPGNCAGAGFYTTADDHRQALLVTEIDGSWQDAARVRGLWALEDHNLSSALLQVSCAAAGYCTAVGSYGDTAGRPQALVVTERDGSWGRAEELHTTSQGGVLYSVSCWARGDCTAAGTLLASTGRWQAFVVSSKDGGRWGSAEVVPGSAALNRGGLASVNYVSCPAAGQCSAAGVYGDASGHEGAFADSERNDVWGTAEEMPGTAKYNSTGFISVYALSCGSPGNCTAGGYYETSEPSLAVPYLEDQVNGTWQAVEPVPGVPVAKIWEGGMVISLSCPAAGSCTAGGLFNTYDRDQQAMVVSQDGGSWGDGQAVPGSSALNQGRVAITEAVSCASPGNCAAGGLYTGTAHSVRAFIASEDNGTWDKAEEVPGTYGRGDPEIDAIACPAAGACTAVGSVEGAGGGADVFVTRQT
jgi:hypothetical protein